VKPKSTWVLLQPHVQSLVESFVFPQLSFNPTRQLLWESDPVDYIRITVGASRRLPFHHLFVVHQTDPHIFTDEYESFATPVSAATTFLFSVASNRTKKTFMPILGFINTVLRSCVLPLFRPSIPYHLPSSVPSIPPLLPSIHRPIPFIPLTPLHMY
jgi:hypothetical protein